MALTGSTTWRINALHSRPATGGSIHALHKATLHTTSHRHHINAFSGRDNNPFASHRSRDDEADDFLGPVLPYGIVFLRGIRLPGDPGGAITCPRLDARYQNSIVEPIEPRFYKGLFGFSFDDVRQLFGSFAQASASSQPKGKILPKPRSILPFPPPRPDDHPSAAVTLPEIVAEDFAPDVDMGEDLDEEEQMVQAVANLNITSFNEDINKLLDAFCSQVLQVIPPPKKNNPAGVLFYHQCRDASAPYDPSLENYQNVDLWLGGFRQIQTREPHKDDWEDRFEYLFPPKIRITRQSSYGRPRKPDAGEAWEYQGTGGYRDSSYLGAWLNIMARCTMEGAKALRAQVKSQFFDKLVWVPWADKFKMWTTSLNVAYTIHRPTKPATGHGSPRVCINPRQAATVMWEGELLFVNQTRTTLSVIGQRGSGSGSH